LQRLSAKGILQREREREKDSVQKASYRGLSLAEASLLQRPLSCRGLSLAEASLLQRPLSCRGLSLAEASARLQRLSARGI